MSKLRDAFKAFTTTLTNVPADMNTFGSMLNEAFAEDQYQPLNLDAMKTNSHVNMAVGKIATNAARTKMTIKSGDEVVENTPLTHLFSWVNELMSEAQLIQASASWWFTRGEFIWILKANLPGKTPTELYIPDPKDMYHYLDKEKENIVMWEYHSPSGDKIPLLPYEVFHCKDWNPFDHFRGVNPLYALANEIESGFYANVLNAALLRNRATPDGVLTTEQALSKEMAKEIKEKWMKAHSTGSAHGIAVLGQGTQYQPIALTLADMEFYTLKKWNRTTIAGKYGVPPIVMGYKDETSSLSGADTKEQMEFFWTQTIIPFLKIVEDKINSDIMSVFAPKQTFLFNYDGIQELATDQEKIRERVRKDIASGLILINEGREEIGRDPLDWGDTWFKPMNLVPYNGEVKEPMFKEPTDDRDMSLMFEEFIDERDTTELFDKPMTEVYSDEYKNTIWHNTNSELDIVLRESKRTMGEWLYSMRSADLEYDSLSDFDKMVQDRSEFFSKYKSALHNASHSLVVGVGEVSNVILNKFYNDISLDDNIGFEMDEDFLFPHVGHFAYFFDQLKEELIRVSDKKLLYNEMKGVLSRITEKESRTLFNEIRVHSFRVNGFKAHVWISPKDGSKIDSEIDGEIRLIGDVFSNGKLMPSNGSITLPVEEK